MIRGNISTPLLQANKPSIPRSADLDCPFRCFLCYDIRPSASEMHHNLIHPWRIVVLTKRRAQNPDQARCRFASNQVWAITSARAAPSEPPVFCSSASLVSRKSVASFSPMDSDAASVRRKTHVDSFVH